MKAYQCPTCGHHFTADPETGIGRCDDGIHRHEPLTVTVSTVGSAIDELPAKMAEISAKAGDIFGTFNSQIEKLTALNLHLLHLIKQSNLMERPELAAKVVEIETILNS